MLRANDRIGPYTLVKQLGKGTFGVVWLAEKRTLIDTHQVAIKFPLDEHPDLEAIKEEARLWAQIGVHANILPMIEANIYDDQVVIVSEYAADGSLEDWIRKQAGGIPPIEKAVKLIISILNGLEHLHGKSILHRDLKPANILLHGETPRLADFGISRILKTTAQSTNAAGTPLYMSPEAFDGKKVVQTDIWAVGVILYQLLSGSFPFPANDITALIGAIVAKDPIPLPKHIPAYLQEIISKALQKDAAKRFQTAAEMGTALKNYGRESITLPKPIPITSKPIPQTRPDLPPKIVEPRPSRIDEPPVIRPDRSKWSSYLVIPGLMIIVIFGSFVGYQNYFSTAMPTSSPSPSPLTDATSSIPPKVDNTNPAGNKNAIMPLGTPKSISSPRSDRSKNGTSLGPNKDKDKNKDTDGDYREGGGNGTYTTGMAGVLSPQILSKQKPIYTMNARSNKIQGVVKLSAVFRNDGTVSDIKVVRGLGYGLDEEAIKAAALIKFVPGTKDGTPVNIRARLEFTFTLK